MAPLVTLTPAARPRERAPRWALVLLAVTFFGAILLPNDPNEVVVFVASIIACVALVMWLEARIYVALSRVPPVLHLILSLMIAPVGLIAGFMAGAFFSALSLEGVVPGLLIGGMWFTSAACGTAVMQFVDLFGRMFASRFSTRIVLTVFGLIAISTVTSVVIVVAIPRVVHEAMEKLPDAKIEINDDTGPLSREQFREFVKSKGLPEIFHDLEADELVGWGLVLALFALLVPGLISSASKLGELAMERVHPLDLALERVAKGDLDVRVEEAGSTEFVRLAAQFNRMVAALDIAQRMERAFGAYVSRPVIDRIRAQHGAIALPSVQKEATVFFADVRGFTSMSEKLSPDKVLEILNRYYGHAVGVVEAHEGYLDKFIGDAMYVIFNGPIDQPDHVERAVRCAIALQEKILILNTSGAFPEIGQLEVGIGLSTGPVVAGNVGTDRTTQFSVMGDTVNLASRLCSHATAGEVWVSAQTAAALPDRIPALALEPIAVKGKYRPVEVYRVFPEPELPDRTPPPRIVPQAQRVAEAHHQAEEHFLDAIKHAVERGWIAAAAAEIVKAHVLRLGERGMNPANTGNLEDLFLHTLADTQDPLRAFAQVLADSMKVVPPPEDAALNPPLVRLADGAIFRKVRELPFDPLTRMLVSHTALPYADEEMRGAAEAMVRACAPGASAEEHDRELHRMILQSQHLPSSAYVLARAHGYAFDLRELARRAGHSDVEVTNIQAFFDIAAEFQPPWLAIFRSGTAPDDPNYLAWRDRYRAARALLPAALRYQLDTDTLTNFGPATMASGKWVDAVVSAKEVRTIDDVPAALAKIVSGYQMEWRELHGRDISEFNLQAGPHLERFGIKFHESGAPVLITDRPTAWNELVVQYARAKTATMPSG